jgi:methionine-rich copper-binding protein CopC
MNIRLLIMIAAAALTAGSVFAHDASKHKGKPVQGEVVSTTPDGFQLKTQTGVLPVTFSSKTKFEQGNATVDKTHVTKGVQVSVFGTKLPIGEMVAREILIGSVAETGHHGAAATKNASQKAPEANTSRTHNH